MIVGTFIGRSLMFKILFIAILTAGLATGQVDAKTPHASKQEHSHSTKGRHGSKGGRHRSRHHRAHRNQGPTVEQVPEEIFPSGHKFTPEEKAEASEIGVMVQNSMWKDAYKLATK